MNIVCFHAPLDGISKFIQRSSLPANVKVVVRPSNATIVEYTRAVEIARDTFGIAAIASSLAEALMQYTKKY